MSQFSYNARWLTPEDCRVTYALARLRRPELSLKDWSSMLQAGAIRRDGAQLIGVSNQSGCWIALLRMTANGIELVAGPPRLLADHNALFRAAESLIRPVAHA